ncbi:tetratricopeptide-like helical domain-containing protein [Artemisia annua]|uniref:Tetratricopeptide-like helical domain-containing protein n=1 Tax=Artemisia annua TaxID=35608 RepID=A0A2U1QK12_ARTAN|nr:tetratricopeptide-like helical domain-containing protein [Artemisia annua]
MKSSVLNFLNNCQNLKSLKPFHSHLVVNGTFSSSDIVLNKIIRLYFRFGSPQDAHKVFDKIPQPNVFLWTSMVHGHVENKLYSDGFLLFRRMLRDSVVPLNFTITAVLKGLAREARVRDGETVYGFVLKYGFDFDVMVQNSTIDFFMRCGKMDLARCVFDEIHEKDTVSWNSMIFGYCNNGRIDIARELFSRMPDRNVISWTSIMCGYVRVGDMTEARALFDAMPIKDTASWNVMLSGYVDFGDIDAAIYIFETMPYRDIGSWNLIISGCCKTGNLESARNYFDKMPSKNVASWTMMIDGYMKSGNVTDAKLLFDHMPEKNLISWSTLIAGYAKNGEPQTALELLKSFKKQCIKPDETFILGVISACSQLGVLDAAESAINDYVGPGLFSNLHMSTSLVDMYAKCGNLEKARQLFEMTSGKDLFCYSIMIAAYANHGMGQEAILLFEEMKRHKLKPDAATFISVLSACNHGGLIDEGWGYFKEMTDEYGIQPIDKHYACMIDLLGRAGRLHDAYNLICSMKVAPTAAVWSSLLAACSVRCNIELAEVAAAELFKIDPDNSGNYVLLSNIYAALGQWKNVSKVRAMMRQNRVRKNRGSSWIELDSVVHEFVMGDCFHLNSGSIHFILDLLRENMKLEE